MSTAPETVMTFPSLDQAESALDWIGLAFIEGGSGGEGGAGGTGEAGWFEGVLDDDAVERLDDAIEDDETPLPVRALATILRERWRAEPARVAWRVTYPVD